MSFKCFFRYFWSVNVRSHICHRKHYKLSQQDRKTHVTQQILASCHHIVRYKIVAGIRVKSVLQQHTFSQLISDVSAEIPILAHLTFGVLFQ